ncbi:hypothetical protein DN310_01595 [Salmonella enterica subsp. salamae]|uniref:Gp12 n=1 Tax=Salmonella enterica subsp. salamae TaxID=59202 RepID=A0A5Y3MLG4_SALER|nr:hypothetical protein [Salmonella enterica]EBQ5245383.1 hypothetical protein [Salmonella enterica subsp. salamae]ECI4008064.1 hypothetical protein [Salmonella enterica subsp. salamae]
MKYIYSGPPSGVSLNEGDTVREVMLWPGQEVEFEPDNEYALSLVAEGHLQEVKPAKRQTTAKEGGAQ